MVAFLAGVTLVLGSHALSGYGITIGVPAGWHARISHGVVAAATFPLPRGDTGFGRAAAARVGRRDVLLAISEYDALPGEHLLCLPRTHAPRLTLADLRKATRGRVLVPLTTLFCLARRHFIVFGRAGAAALSAGALAHANALLASLAVRRGDFYPGRVPPARFPRRRGWHVGTGGPGANTANGEQTQSWASTAPYADRATDLPPDRSVRRLGRDGVLIWLGLSRDSRLPPPAFTGETPLPLRIDPRRIRASWEGAPARNHYGLYRQTSSRRGQYDLDLWVFFGSPHPSAASLARARAELAGVRLPYWRPF